VRLVLVHGFTQTPRSWGPIAAALRADGHEVHTPALPGHDGTAPLSLPEGAARLAAQWGKAVWVGYSMGGRLCLQLALDHPGAVDALVLLGATAGIDDPAERAARRRHDAALAARVEQVGVRAFLAEWLAQPLFAGLPDDPAERAERARNTAAGLAGALRLAGTGTQDPLWDRLGELRERAVPTLVMAGEHDAKFRALARRLAHRIGPSARCAWVSGAGHAAHLERPASFLAHLRSFLSEVGAGSPPASSARPAPTGG
jgi:2-succinyl-6-hydroxy-2,4-cyclohexadiene-1-carboxylate synthase